MFFILSKVLFFLIMPFWWIIILLIWMWASKKPTVKKRIRILTIIILIVFTNPFLYRNSIMLWQPQPTRLTPGQKFEAGIVLGGLAGYDKNLQGYFGNNADRFIQTANLYHQGIIKKIIVSGGSGKLAQDDQPESFFLRTQFIANGVPGSDIIIESRSRNTSENAIYSKRISDSLHLKSPFVLITSAEHMRRSINVFKKVGFNCIPFPCDYKVTPQKNSPEYVIVPNISLLNEWGDFLKEIVGLWVYRLTGKA